MLLLVYLLISIAVSTAITSFDKVLNVINEDNFLEMYVPTYNSRNAQCRNHSLYYVEELRKLAIWATEMFDASGKMPSGVLYGSSHNLGNYDECLDIRVLYNEHEKFSGQYCLAKLTITPPNNINIKHQSSFYLPDNYITFFNQSLWEKMTIYSMDKMKGPRNELYTALCLPSSCSFEDLKEILEKNSASINELNDFRLVIDIDKYDCQIYQPTELSIGDNILISFLLFSLIVVVFSSVYHVLTSRDRYKHLQMKGKGHNVILCFSFCSNYKKFISNNQNTDGLDCLAGMKVFSMFMIIVLHRIMFDFGSPMLNPEYVEELYTKFETILLLNGPILVETFFTISGFLATFLILGQLQKNNKTNLAVFYIHRFVRVLPTYAVVIAFYCTLFIKLGSGPLWQHRVGVEQERCTTSWWANLLFINNYVNTDKICMFQSWFITCDMNFFIFSPVLTWFLWQKPKLGLTLVFSLIISSIIVVFTKVYIDNLDAMYMIYLKALKDPVSHDTFKTLYIPGHMRASSYFIGTLAGYYKFQIKENDHKISRNYVKIGWIFSIPTMIISLATGYIFYLYDVHKLLTALYAALYHPLWSICIAWIIIVLSLGHEPLINSFLSWRPLTILAKLSFCVYISHGIIQMYTAGSIRTPTHVSIFNLGYKTVADIVLGYTLAFILSMVYESPVIALEKLLLQKGGMPPKKENTEKQNNIDLSREIVTEIL